jgi:hydrogenase/urease accessory protein HupE
LLPAPAIAHEVGLSRGDYRLEGARAIAELTFAQREIAGIAPELDADRDGSLSEAELREGQDALRRAVVERVSVTGDGKPCPGKLGAARAVERDGLTIAAEYACAAPPAELRFDLALLEDLPFGHRHIFRTSKGFSLTETILYQKRRSVDVRALPEGSAAPPGDAGSAPAPEATASAAPRGMLDLFLMGIEHILLGFDHLVFLLGLVLVGGRWRSLLLVVTAFTVAHSITLGLATLGVWTPSPKIIEPAIALSIAYVGVENFFVDDAEKRWRITLPFGLVHGFGFAGVLQDVALPAAQVPAALLAFNLGVEAGQIAVLAVVLPLLLYARRRGVLDRRRVKVLSGVIIAAGLVWFVERVAGA